MVSLPNNITWQFATVCVCVLLFLFQLRVLNADGSESARLELQGPDSQPVFPACLAVTQQDEIVVGINVEDHDNALDPLLMFDALGRFLRSFAVPGLQEPYLLAVTHTGDILAGSMDDNYFYRYSIAQQEVIHASVVECDNLALMANGDLAIIGDGGINVLDQQLDDQFGFDVDQGTDSVFETFDSIGELLDGRLVLLAKDCFILYK
eukprot:TRINITY_DN9209_c0_g1_i1.p1 TRINITY_DN9209_c0_g1~~TRINITY_DN9209_c0_g1_i1.p1  ORF type:complete len:207 (+),score=70.10 TRINITY_DN9209_c0_g1_i1:223-843(+)